MFIDPYYLALVAPALILSLIAQIKVKSTFSKYSRIRCSRGITGRDTAALLLRKNGIASVALEKTGGSLTDHYDPSAKKLRLSEPVYDAPSIAAVGVAAHETGHAIQHAKHYGPLTLRGGLVPVASIGSSMGPWVAIAGLAAGIPLLTNIGIALFGGAVLFHLITLPVELNASSRALALLKGEGILTPTELQGVKKVLTAAAFTYIASALTSLMSLLRLVLLSRNRKR